MAREINLNELGGEFVLRFDGNLSKIKTETYANSLLEITHAVNEICRIVSPDSELNLYINATAPGSFNSILELQEALMNAISSDNHKSVIVALFFSSLISVFSNPIIENLANMDFDIDSNFDFSRTENNFYIGTPDDLRLILPKAAEDPAREILESPKISMHILKSYSDIYADKEIESFEWTNNLKSKHPIFRVTRQDINNFETKLKSLEKDEKFKGTKLQIIRASFKRDRVWRFLLPNENEISAKILDNKFLDDLIDRGYSIKANDTLTVNLTRRVYLDYSNYRFYEEYWVEEVLKHSLSN